MERNSYRRFSPAKTNGTDINLQCADRDNVILKNGDNVRSDNVWLATMKQDEVEDLIESTSVEDLCGRRPWLNVAHHERLYEEGTPHGGSGLPYGPDPAAIFKRDRSRDLFQLKNFWLEFQLEKWLEIPF